MAHFDDSKILALDSVMHAIILVHTCRYLYLLLGKYVIYNFLMGLNFVYLIGQFQGGNGSQLQSSKRSVL